MGSGTRPSPSGRAGTATRRYRIFPPSPRNGEVRPSRDIRAAPAGGRTGQKAVVRARPPAMLTTGSRQFLEQRLGVFQVGGVEALGEPAVNRRQQIARLGPPALFAPQPSEIAGGAQFERFRLLGLGDADRLLKGGLALVALVFSEQHRSGKAVQFRVPLTLAGGVRYFQSLPQCGQCRHPIAAARQTLGQGRQTKRQIESPSEPGPFRYALANAGNSFVDGTLSEQCRATQHAWFEIEREPLLRSHRLSSIEMVHGSVWLTAIEVNLRRKKESKAQRERVGDPLGQRQALSDAGERLVGISEQRFGPSARNLGANTGIVSAVDEPMGRMLLRIVEKAPGVGVLASFCRIPRVKPRRPAAVMRLKPQSFVSVPFGHPQQPL